MVDGFTNWMWRAPGKVWIWDGLRVMKRELRSFVFNDESFNGENSVAWVTELIRTKYILLAVKKKMSSYLRCIWTWQFNYMCSCSEDCMFALTLSWHMQYSMCEDGRRYSSLFSFSYRVRFNCPIFGKNGITQADQKVGERKLGESINDGMK